MTSPEDSGEYFKTVVDRLIEEACLLLEDVLKATEASDSRAKAQKAHWTERHRLQVLLEAAVETQKSLPSTIVAPWFLAELRGTLDVVRRWQQSPYWPNIEKSLKDKDAFDHTIAMLHVAEHLEWGGHKVEIVKEGISPSPDLTLRAIGGSQDAIVIECYQPAVLRGKPSELVTKEAERLSLPLRRPRRRRVGPVGEIVNKAEYPNHVWSYDFVEDRTERGGKLRILVIIDEYTRECLAIRVAPSIPASVVVEVLEWLFLTRGVRQLPAQ